MTDQMQDYFQAKEDARLTGLPGSTFLTPDGIQVEVVPAEDALGERSMAGPSSDSATAEDAQGFMRATGSAVVGGIRDAMQGLIGLGTDIGDAVREAGVPLPSFDTDTGSFISAEDTLAKRAEQRAAGEPGGVQLPDPIPPGESGTEAFFRGTVAFFAPFIATGGLGGANAMQRIVSATRSGAIADLLFDPAGGTMISMLKEVENENGISIVPEMLEFLNAKADTDATATERLRVRLVAALEGSILGVAIDGIIEAVVHLRANPELRARATETLGQLLADETDAMPRASQIAMRQARADLKERVRAGEDFTDNPNVDPDEIPELQREIELEAELGDPVDLLPGEAGVDADTPLHVSLTNLDRGVPSDVPGSVQVGDFPVLPRDPKAPRVRRSMSQLLSDAVAGQDYRQWYEVHRPIMESIFGDDMQLFNDIVAITSQQASVDENIDRALRAYQAIKAGDSLEGQGLLVGVVNNLERLVGKRGPAERGQSPRLRTGKPPSPDATGGETYFAGKKIPDFVEAMRGSHEAVVMDRHMAQLLFGVSQPTMRQVIEGQRVVTKVANDLGWTPRETQAALWAFNQVRKGMDIDNVRDYRKVLTEREAEIRRFVEGIQNPGGQSRSLSPGSAARGGTGGTGAEASGVGAEGQGGPLDPNWDDHPPLTAGPDVTVDEGGTAMTPELQTFIDENAQKLSAFQRGSLTTERIKDRIQIEFDAITSQQAFGAENLDLPTHTVDGVELKPLVFINPEEITTIPEISQVARVLADEIGVPPIGTMREDVLGGIEVSAELPLGGKITLELNPLVDAGHFRTTLAHEIGHIITYRTEQLRRAFLSKDDMRGEAVDLGIEFGGMPGDEAVMFLKDQLFDDLMAFLTHSAIEGSPIYRFRTTTDAKNHAFDIMYDMENLSRTNRPASWKWAEGGHGVIKGEGWREAAAAETDDFQSAIDLADAAEKASITNKERDLMRGYLHQPSELFADSTAQFMMHPDEVKADYPHFAAFLKDLVNRDGLISQVIAFAGLSSVMLPGITDLVNDVNPEFIGESDGG